MGGKGRESRFDGCSLRVAVLDWGFPAKRKAWVGLHCMALGWRSLSLSDT